MAKRGNPEVRVWMKEHSEEVEQVQQRYNALREVSLQSLLESAPLTDADVNKIRDLCIARMIAAESAR